MIEPTIILSLSAIGYTMLFEEKEILYGFHCWYDDVLIRQRSNSIGSFGLGFNFYKPLSFIQKPLYKCSICVSGWAAIIYLAFNFSVGIQLLMPFAVMGLTLVLEKFRKEKE